MPTSHFLQALTGLNAGCVFVLSAHTVMGRSPEAAVQVMDPQASREHATVIIEDGSAVLTDLSSGNGTFVGDERISRRQLRSGDVLRIGTSEFAYGEVEGAIDDPESMTRAVKVINLRAVRADTLMAETIENIRRGLGRTDATPNAIDDAPGPSSSVCADPLHDLAAVRGWAHCPACGRPIQS